MTAAEGIGKTPEQLILAGIERREALAQLMAVRSDEYGRMGSHILAVLAAAREELADALSQQERHVLGEGWCAWCIEDYPCPDAQQAARTMVRLARLYGETSA